MAVDIWSLGCIMGQMMSQIFLEKSSKRAFFRGNSCYPLSPADETLQRVKGSDYVAKKDQILAIIKNLGHPSHFDQSFISDDQALTYLENIENPKYNKNALYEMFSAADPDLIELLKGLLEFNPFFRLTA